MKTKSPKSRALAALLRLVTRKAPQAQISAANDRFYARWKHDGLAMLVAEHGRGK